MAKVALGGAPCNTLGNLPAVGSKAKEFILKKNDLSVLTLMEMEGSRVILNIFPSVDTGTCATSVRAFNKLASEMDNTKVVCVSRDLPFAQKRFCEAEGIENVITVSDFATGQFGRDYGVELIDGGFKNLHARAIVVLDEKGSVLHTELVPEIANEPNYKAALSVL
ncbi:thiol peroxidase [Crocinitomicaceae bacterium]|jgi:thioredoxin-dependent peroxiredoxin|nr:thiol peroxidase [Crocinitomicaceae bacterium]MDG1347362.1 thiol peroxidase [Crocinitomicaceae bacterium]MDG2463932.1 thiol peroxidase [Crocinitomicaceae bacterium]